LSLELRMCRQKQSIWWYYRCHKTPIWLNQQKERAFLGKREEKALKSQTQYEKQFKLHQKKRREVKVTNRNIAWGDWDWNRILVVESFARPPKLWSGTRNWICEMGKKGISDWSV